MAPAEEAANRIQTFGIPIEDKIERFRRLRILDHRWTGWDSRNDGLHHEPGKKTRKSEGHAASRLWEPERQPTRKRRLSWSGFLDVGPARGASALPPIPVFGSWAWRRGSKDGWTPLGPRARNSYRR